MDGWLSVPYKLFDALVRVVRPSASNPEEERMFDEMLRQCDTKTSPGQTFLILCMVDKRLSLGLGRDVRKLLYERHFATGPFAPAEPGTCLVLHEHIKVRHERVTREALLVIQAKNDLGAPFVCMLLVPLDGQLFVLLERTWRVRGSESSDKSYLYGIWLSEDVNVHELRFPLTQNVAGPWLSAIMSSSVKEQLNRVRWSNGFGSWLQRDENLGFLLGRGYREC